MTTIEVQVLGRFALLRGGEPVPPAAFGGRLARTMFRILLVERGTVVPRFSLIDALWGDEPPADPDANLNVLANRIRRALGLPGLLVTGEAGYALAHDTGCNVDADLFSGRVAAGLACAADGKPAAALRELDMALRMWAEPLPEDTLKAWAHQYRERLHRQRSDALAASAESALALHDHARAGACATEAALEQPLSEAPQLLLARVLAAAGDVAGALRIITGFRDRLAEELGLDPSPEAAELHLRLLRGESLPPPTRHPARVLHMPSSEELAFVGRAAATADLLRTVQAVPRATALVLGSAGAGKSRLLAEVALRLDVPVVSARAYLDRKSVV